MDRVTQLICAVKPKLYSLSLSDLRDVVNFVKPRYDVKGKTKLEVIKEIDTLLDEETKDHNDGGAQFYQCLLEEADKKLKANEDKTQHKTSPENNSSSTHATQDLSSFFKRDFKISGQIGLSGQKDKLSFSSLARQIETGVKKGYKPDEITEAVIKAIIPGLSIRSYLEGRDGLTLPALRRILRSHFHEKSPTELFQQLSSAVQGVKEGAMSFLMRVLDLRQKVLFVSQEDNLTINYDQHLVMAVARRSILTGLRNDAIRQQLQPLLENDVTSDEDLIQQLSLTLSAEAEKDHKLSRPNTVKVGEVVVDPVDELPAETDVKKIENQKKGGLKAEVQELKKTVELLAEQVAQLNVNRNSERQNQNGKRPRGCPLCRMNDSGEWCDHCFKCGQSDHFLTDCPLRTRKAGNDQRSQ